MRREDSPSIPQLAVPVEVPIECFKQAYGTADNGAHVAADLALIAFSFLLRVVKYTLPRKVKRNGKWKRVARTVQFQLNNVGFYKEGHLLPRDAPLNVLLQANAVTLKITNQKNGYMGQTIYLPTIDKEHSPVKVLARRVHHILRNRGIDEDLICMFESNGKLVAVTPTAMIKQLQEAVKALQLRKKGIDPDLIGAHSL
eukprot:7704167-Ditylum_brightwellii.AAC.1